MAGSVVSVASAIGVIVPVPSCPLATNAVAASGVIAIAPDACGIGWPLAWCRWRP
jgi:hypothetical protein